MIFKVGDSITTLLLVLTQGIYSVAAELYSFLIQIASFEVISQLNISEIYMKVYTILGILVLFRLVITAITYFMDPDSGIGDKNQNSGSPGKVVVRIIAVFAMLALCPFVFSLLYRLQYAIIQDNILGRIFSENPETLNGNVVVTIPKVTADIDIPILFWEIDVWTNTTQTTALMTPGKSISNAVYSAFVSCSSDSDNENWKAICETSAKYPILIAPGTMEAIDDVYDFNVKVIPAIIFGIILNSFILVTCVDMALRSVKLGVLQLIAPVAIVAYIDPKTEDKFKSWLSMLGKVYGDLFMRIGLIYLLSFVIGNLIF